MPIDPLAGKPAPASLLVDLPKLITAYYTERPDADKAEQRVAFGTSGHRGSSFHRQFNEWHILAISQAISDYRAQQSIKGPLFLGFDTHALSYPAYVTAIEVLTANGVPLMLAQDDAFTPTPVISHAILTYNHGRKDGLADGIVITPSHNPPHEGGFKYNPPHGGPAEQAITHWIEERANNYLQQSLQGVKRLPIAQALEAKTIIRHDFVSSYVDDLEHVVDMAMIAKAKLKLGVDPLGGAGVHYWRRIAQRYALDLEIINETVDPTFRFMTVDWDGQIRMDPSSSYAMRSLIGLKDRFQVAFACDTDHDRHGIVTASQGLLQPNHFLSVAVHYLFQNRPRWPKTAAVGKTLVSSQMIDRVTGSLGRVLCEVPVGFKWFVDGLLHSTIGFGGEESAGASFLRMDGSVWTTDKDGIIMALLAAEITAKTGKDPGQYYQDLTTQFGNPVYSRMDAPATTQQKAALKRLVPEDIHAKEIAGDTITQVLTRAPGNNEPIGGVKVVAQESWFAARPSGTEEIYKIYAESFQGEEQLAKIQKDAQAVVNEAFASVTQAH